jgi:hypothetical protein
MSQYNPGYQACYPIDKKLELWIYDKDVDREKLARNFRLAWKRVPAVVRTALTEYWRECTFCKDGMPLIQMMRTKAGFESGKVGLCERLGSELSFDSQYCDQLLGTQMQSLFIHEIGHAYRCCIGTAGDNKEEEEDAVDELMEEWGIEPW